MVAVTTAGLVAVSDPVAAASVTLAPASVTVQKGGATGATPAALAVDDGEVATFGPGASRSEIVFAPSPGLDPASVWGLTVEATWRGPARSTQRWTWKLRNHTRSRWDAVGDNTGVAAGTWTARQFFVGGRLADYLEPGTGRIRLRLEAPDRPATATLDRQVVVLEHGPLPTHPGWKPPVGARWQYQLQGPVDTTLCVPPWAGGACVTPQVYDIDAYAPDGVTPNTAGVAAVHAAGGRAVCYVSAGAWEDWRPDAGAFPPFVLGRSNGWPGERWLDVRRLDVLLPIMDARVEACAAAGFDAVEFDNVDGYANRTGFPLTASDQVRYNRMLAALAHGRGLSVGLKNAVELLTQLRPWFDFAVNEQCHQYRECGGYDAWVGAGKAVLQVEYTSAPGAFCPPALAAGRSAIRKALALEATPWLPCA